MLGNGTVARGNDGKLGGIIEYVMYSKTDEKCSGEEEISFLPEKLLSTGEWYNQLLLSFTRHNFDDISRTKGSKSTLAMVRL